MSLWLAAVLIFIAKFAGIFVGMYLNKKKEFYAGTLVLVPKDSGSPIEAYISFTEEPKTFKPGQVIYMDVAIHSQENQGS